MGQHKSDTTVLLLHFWSLAKFTTVLQRSFVQSLWLAA